MASLVPSLSLLFLFNLILAPVLAEVIFEDGYSVSTVIDGNKNDINPHTVIPVLGSTDLIILDSSASTFYKVSHSKNSDVSISKLTGTGVAGYMDGSLDIASFNKPKSFAVDSKGNVYVADIKNKHAIRKISKSGVTTIAGGYSLKPGRTDGPALNASFSDDVELSFLPERCTLMISDRGSKLVRQVQLKAEDCSRDSHSVLGAVSSWFLTVGLPCLVCLIIGLAIRPYVIPNECCSHLQRNMTRKQFLISPERQVLMYCFGIRSAIVDSKIYSFLRKLFFLSLSHLSHMCLMFRPKIVESQTSRRKPVPILSFDDCKGNEPAKSPTIAYNMEDLISFDDGLDDSGLTTNQVDPGIKINDVSIGNCGKVDSMILANLVGFAEQGSASSGPDVSLGSLGLINRKKKAV